MKSFGAIKIGFLIVFSLGTLFFFARNPFNVHAAPQTNVSGAISSNTTWNFSGSPYVVTGDVTVNAGVTLTIEPGVEVKFNGNYALIVLGRLIAQGTGAAPITFTSNQASPAAGDWAMLDFRNTSIDSLLENSIIEYGGNSSRAGVNCWAGMICVNTSSFRLESSTLRYSATRGLVLTQTSSTIYENTFDHITLEAIRLHGCNVAVGECHPLIIGNTFTNNQYPILVDHAQLPDISGNQASNNQVNGLILNPSCNIPGTNTFYSGDLPYVVALAGGWCTMGSYGVESDFTIQPGTVFKSLGTITFQYTSEVTATGTLEEPIIFTSLKDDSVGGDTNNDGSLSSPAVLDWGNVDHYGALVQGKYDHVIFRYGGNTSSSWGPLFTARGGTNVTIDNSEFSQSRVGVDTRDLSPVVIRNSSFHDLATAGVANYSTGSILVENNRFVDITSYGVYVYYGTPLIRENFFQGNDNGVYVANTTPNPVVSPHNSFVGAGQTGIYVNWPGSVCVDARQNWWGDVSGPQDSSTAADACGMADNPGTGLPVSNGVNYSPWEGGMGRPVIGSPRCGVTAQDQPTFSGLSAAGALVSFYDDGVKIGTTTAAVDDSFSWTPSSPLTDGLHNLSAIAELDGQTSLPSPIMELEVDSSLTYDPAGVRILYDLHGSQFVQTMRDANGCTSRAGNLDTPIWVRPGTTMTVIVPIRSITALDLPATNKPILDEHLSDAAPMLSPPSIMLDLSGFLSPEGSVTITNNSTQTIKGWRSASSEGAPGNHIFGPYGTEADFNNGITEIPPGLTGEIVVSRSGDLALVTDGGVVFRQEVDPSTTTQVTVPDIGPMGTVEFRNETGSNVETIYIGRTYEGALDYIGGNNLVGQIPPNDSRLIDLTAGSAAGADYYAVAVDSNAVFHPVKLHVPSQGRVMVPISPEFGELNIINKFDRPICKFGLVPYDDDEDNTKPSENEPLNLLQILLPYNSPPALGGGVQLPKIKLAPGRYFWKAYYCDYTLAGGGNVDISTGHTNNNAQVLSISPCTNIIKIGSNTFPMQKKQNLISQPEGATSGQFEEWFATFDAVFGPLSFSTCDGEGFSNETGAGPVLIDPDGYVYDSALGISSKITGATVTCSVYDEDYQTWSRWPAEIYESQVNPQVTVSDGYYAFFVPLGLYRVEASAPGYSSHVSPNIQVINEIVHYNIPLIKQLTTIFLPFLVR